MSDLSCDVCGREGVFAVIMLEGAKLLACQRCARSGKILYRLNDKTPIDLRPAPRKPSFDDEKEIVEGYGSIIRSAREKAGLKVDTVAERISEKASYLEKIEHEKLAPTIVVARKLEKELGIKLIERSTAELSSAGGTKSKFSEPTLGDMLDAAKKKGSK